MGNSRRGRRAASARAASGVDPRAGARQAPESSGACRRRRACMLACVLALAALTVVIYAPVRHYDFVTLDDPKYVSENPHVSGGLTREAVVWALTTSHGGYWIPLTWLSYSVEVEIFGTGAGWHHVTNVLLHMANSILLFAVLRGATGAAGRSLVVAALFAAHPLHVESVAWVTERKDVLSTLFWMLAIAAYLRHAREPRPSRLAVALLLFALGLMAKPMLVTLPLVLLLLDVWPLDRAPRGARPEAVAPTPVQAPVRAWGQLLVEKLPFLVLSGVFGIVTYFAQASGGAVASLEQAPLGLRLGNAVVSYVAYIGKMLWPAGLSPFYPLPDTVPAWQVAGATALLLGTSIAVLRMTRRRPYLAVGWFWFVLTLVPVIGVVQVGVQAMADRFTYVPLIGLYVVIAWGVPDLAARWRAPGWLLPAVATVIVGACAVAARGQLAYWKDSTSFWSRATELTLGLDRPQAHLALGRVLREQGRMDEAIGHFRAAVGLTPDEAALHHELGLTLAGGGRLEEAVQALSEAVRLRPDLAAAHSDLGVALARQGKVDEAIARYREALRLDPRLPEVHNNLGATLLEGERYEEALPHCAEAVRLRPDFELARVNLGVALAKTGRIAEAVEQFRRALEINPANPIARRAYDELAGRRRE